VLLQLLFFGRLCVVAFLIALSSAACGGSASDVDAVLDGGTADSFLASDGGKLDSDDSVFATAEHESSLLSDASFSASSILSGMEDYDGYRQDMKLTFEGFDADGRAESWWVSVSTLVDFGTESRAVEIVSGGFEGTGDLPASVKIWRGDGVGYLYMLDTGCVSGPDIGIDSAGSFSPEIVVGEIEDAEIAEQDLVLDGVVGHYYEFSEEASSALRELPFKVDGQVFVPAEGRYVKLLALKAEGEGDLVGDGQIRRGVYSLTVDNWPANDSIVVEQPGECADNLPYPVMEEAQEITSIDEVVSYKVPAEVGDIIEFYRTEMVRSGWNEVSEPAVFDDIAILVYQKGSDEVIVQIAFEQNLDFATVFISP
jgi:hypothetical protein